MGHDVAHATADALPSELQEFSVHLLRRPESSERGVSPWSEVSSGVAPPSCLGTPPPCRRAPTALGTLLRNPLTSVLREGGASRVPFHSTTSTNTTLWAWR